MRDRSRSRKIRPGLAESIRTGQAVPVISDEAIFDLALALTEHSSLTEAYADYAHYPLADREDLPRVAKFHKLSRQKQALLEGDDFTHNDLRADYLDFVKDFIYAQATRAGVPGNRLAEAEAQWATATVSEFAGVLGYPRFDRGKADPLQVLANLPFRVLLTTSPYRFLEAALQKADKTPRTAVIRWRQDLRDLIDPAIPSVPAGKDPARFPLVCHLFGLETESKSLVLTEDDYLDFLVDATLCRGARQTDTFPSEVRGALSSDLLVLGFSLKGWAFRTLYFGLIKSDDPVRDEKRGICVQVPPSEAERAYLHDYLQREARFDVDWRNLSDFAADLSDLI